MKTAKRTHPAPADATTEVVVTSGSVFSHAGFAALDLHGSEFDLQASLFGPGIGDFAPDDLCSPLVAQLSAGSARSSSSKDRLERSSSPSDATRYAPVRLSGGE